MKYIPNNKWDFITKINIILCKEPTRRNLIENILMLGPLGMYKITRITKNVYYQ